MPNNICSNTTLNSTDLASLRKEFNFIRRYVCQAIASGGGGGDVTIVDIGANTDGDPAQLNTIQYNDDGDIFVVNGSGEVFHLFSDSSNVLLASEPLGDFTNTTFPGSTLPTGWVTGGTAPTVNNGLQITAGDGGYYTGYAIYSENATASLNFTITSEFTLVTKPASSAGGLVIGRMSSGNLFDLAVRAVRSDATHWKVDIHLIGGHTPGAAVGISSAAIDMTEGASYRLYASSSNNKVFAKLSRINIGLNPFQDEIENCFLLYNYVPVPVSAQFCPNTGYPWISGLGGSYTITKFQEYHYDDLNTDVVILGDSISSRYYSTNVQNHYTYKLFENTTSRGAVFAGPSDTISQSLLRLKEVVDISPKYVMIALGVNDLAAAISANLPTLIDALQAANITVIYLKVFTPDITKDSIIKTICESKNVQLIDPGKIMDASYFVDGIHFNDKGNAFVANFIRAEAPFLINHTGGTDLYTLQGLSDILLTSPATGEVLSYNSVTGQWNNTTLPSGTFINNQFASPQTANFKITGYATVGSGFGIGADVTSNYKFESTEATADLYGWRATNTSATAASGFKTLNIGLAGGTGFGVTGWANAGVIENLADGGLVLSGYANGINFQTGSSRTSRMFISAAGFVGIGTGTPSASLDVKGNCQIGRSVSYSEGLFNIQPAIDTWQIGDWNGDVGNSLISGNPSANTISYSADTHTFTGTVTMSNLAAGGIVTADHDGLLSVVTGTPVSTISNNRVTGQTAAATLPSYAVGGASDESLLVSANVLVTTATLHNFGVRLGYTDEGGTPRTVTMNFSTLAGALTPSITNAGGAVPYEGVPLHIRAQAGTNVTLSTAGTFTTTTYNFEAIINKINL